MFKAILEHAQQHVVALAVNEPPTDPNFSEKMTDAVNHAQKALAEPGKLKALIFLAVTEGDETASCTMLSAGTVKTVETGLGVLKLGATVAQLEGQLQNQQTRRASPFDFLMGVELPDAHPDAHLDELMKLFVRGAFRDRG